MESVARFVFSAFAENTYVVADPGGECAIVDPGCSDAEERQALKDYIARKQLRPVRLLNTHCHIDHVMGNRFVADTWGLVPEGHQGEQVVLDTGVHVAAAYGLEYLPSPALGRFLEPGDVVEFGSTRLEVLFTPGHSPASICFYQREGGYVLCGDTLFRGSIGRTDLPGGDGRTLMESIARELLSLPPQTRLLPGHMEETTVEQEARSNPFVLAWQKGMPIG
jgi:hydroxyacylglutathione hydrolase